MKNIKCISILLFIVFLFSASCRESKIDEQILLDIEDFNDSFHAFELNRGNFLPERNYISPSTENINGIISSNYNFNDDKFYFWLTKKYDTADQSTGRNMIAYVNIKTGIHHYICTDLLCKHTEFDECKYLNFSDIYFAEKNVFYTARMDDSIHTIYQVDLDRDSVVKVYKSQGSYLRAIGSYKKNFYFFEINHKTVNKETKYYENLKSIDINTKNIEEHGCLLEKYTDINASVFYIGNDKFYFMSLNKIFTTDLFFENETLICKIAEDERIGDYYYDEKTDELFFNVRNQEENTGTIYVYKNDELNKINMPHENIYCFQLTNNMIYYSPYDPIYYGTAADFQHTQVYDYTGGKIYAADKNNPIKAKLIFDAEKNFIIYNPFNSYVIIGDYLYFDDPELVEDGEFIYFNVAQKLEKVRINMKENTIKYIRFE
ncbi:MAG: hypothetical protein FWG34_13035 [Oscillospiraceae bacterium]|nr:hypothetical protein [Oscillospiraceae bacterium]